MQERTLKHYFAFTRIKNFACVEIKPTAGKILVSLRIDPTTIAIIREDNAFRYDKDVLPAVEGAALWAAFNVEMDRLYAVMNQGKEPDLGD